MDLRDRVHESEHWSGNDGEQVLGAAFVQRTDHAKIAAVGIFGAAGAMAVDRNRAAKESRGELSLHDRLDEKLIVVLTNERLAMHSVSSWGKKLGKLIHEWPIDEIDEIAEGNGRRKSLKIKADFRRFQFLCKDKESRERMASAFEQAKRDR